MKKAFKLIVAKSRIILALTLISCVILGYFSTKLEIDASTQTLLLENDKDLAIWREVSKRYETPNFLVVAYSPSDDLLSRKSLDTIKDLSEKLSAVKGVKNVTSILNAPLLENKKAPLSELIKHIPTLGDADINFDAARREFVSNPLYKNALVSEDLKTTSIVVNLENNDEYNAFLERLDKLNSLSTDGNFSAQSELQDLKKRFKAYRDTLRIAESEQIEKIKAIIAENPQKNKLFLGGINMIANDMISFVRSDLIIYGTSVALLLAFCLWLFFRQIRFVVLPVFICVLSVFCASGLFGLLGYEITVISSNYTALQLIITVSLVIHLIVGYREFYELHHEFTQAQLVYLTLRSRFSPCFFAIFTTVIGFASLIFSNIKPVISLGIMMSASISVSFIIAFLVFGSLMANLKKIPPKKSFENSFKFTINCARVALKKRVWIYAYSMFALVFGFYGISQLKVENSFIGYFKQNTDIYKGMAVIDKRLGGTIPIDITIGFKDANKSLNSLSQSSNLDEFSDFDAEFSIDANDPKYWFSERKMQILRKVDEFLQKREFIGNVSSLATLLSVGKSLNNGIELDSLAMALLYNGLPSEFKDILLTPYVNIENNEIHFVVRVVDSDPKLRRDEFIKNLRVDLNKLLADDDVRVQVSGIMVLYNNVLQSLISSQIDTLGFTALVLFVVFLFIFRSLRFASIAIISTLVPLCAVFGAMGVLGINLDIMSITIAAISLGIGVDDIIHYIHRFKLERKKHSIEVAILSSHSSIGYAMYYTSFAIFLGFSVMVSSNFLPTIYFGALTDLVMVLMLLGALLLLPALIISTSKFEKIKVNSHQF